VEEEKEETQVTPRKFAFKMFNPFFFFVFFSLLLHYYSKLRRKIWGQEREGGERDL